MSDRFPLIFNPTANQIQELAVNSNLDLTSSGITGVTNISASGIVTATDFNSTSDINLKENIKIIDDPIDKVLKLNGVSFNWKDTHQSSAGLIAQEVEKVLPEIVRENNGNKSLNYNGLIGLLVEVVKQQQEQINTLRTRLEILEE